MAKKKNIETTSQDIRDLYIDERTEDKIQEHLTNEEDIITEEDIANAPAGIVPGKELVHHELPPGQEEEEMEEEEQLEKTKLRDNDDPAIETSWNVLGS